MQTLRREFFNFLGSRTADLLAAITEMLTFEREKLNSCVKSEPLFVEVEEALKAKAYRHKLRRRIHMLERSSTKLRSTQTFVQKQFADLRDLVIEKQHRLYELLALNRLYDEVSEIEVISHRD